MSAHAALMQVVHDGLLRTSEYASVRHKLRLGHIFGEGNVWADAESRGYDDVLAALSAQLGVTPSGAPVPPHAVALLNRVTVLRSSFRMTFFMLRLRLRRPFPQRLRLTLQHTSSFPMLATPVR